MTISTILEIKKTKYMQMVLNSRFYFAPTQLISSLLYDNNVKKRTNTIRYIVTKCIVI